MANLYNERRHMLPASYVAHIEKYGGWEGDLGDDLGYLVLWDKNTLQDRYIGYKMDRYLSNRWFPFGSNGGSDMLCFDLPSGLDQVFVMPYLGMSDDDALLQYETFEEIAAAVAKNAEPLYGPSDLNKNYESSHLA